MMATLADLSQEEINRARALAQRVEQLSQMLNEEAEQLAEVLKTPTERDYDARGTSETTARGDTAPGGRDTSPSEDD